MINSEDAQPIHASSAKVFHGSKDRWNPELLYTAAVSECHMLTFLFLAHRAEIDVLEYTDQASCTVTMDKDGLAGEITDVQLNPVVTVASKFLSNEELNAILQKLNAKAPDLCFIRRSITAHVSENLRIVIES